MGRGDLRGADGDIFIHHHRVLREARVRAELREAGVRGTMSKRAGKMRGSMRYATGSQGWNKLKYLQSGVVRGISRWERENRVPGATIFSTRWAISCQDAGMGQERGWSEDPPWTGVAQR